MVSKNKVEDIDNSLLDSELIELEFDQDCVEYYIVDEQDNEIGVCLNEDGNLVEYMYEPTQNQSIDIEKEKIQETAKLASEKLENVKKEINNSSQDVKEVAKELKDTAKDIQDIMSDLKDSFKIFPSKKK